MISMIRAQKSHRTDKCNLSPSGFVLRKEVGDRYIQIDCQRWAWVWVMLKRFSVSFNSTEAYLYVIQAFFTLHIGDTEKENAIDCDYISKATVMPL